MVNERGVPALRGDSPPLERKAMINITGPRDAVKLFVNQDAQNALYFIHRETRELVHMYVDNVGADTATLIYTIDAHSFDPEIGVVVMQANNDFATRDIDYRLRAGIGKDEVSTFLLDSLLVTSSGNYSSALCEHEWCCPIEGKSIHA